MPPLSPRCQTCPSCGRQFEFGAVGEAEVFPFCSKRCKLVDLHGWLEHGWTRALEGTPDFEMFRALDAGDATRP